MRQHIVENYEMMSRVTADIVTATLSQGKPVNLSLTGGDSPKGAYNLLVERLQTIPTLCEKAYFFNFDSAPINGKDAGTEILMETFYKPAGITADRVYSINEENYTVYDDIIAQKGGLDLMLIGIGSDGHFCGNLPGATRFEEYTYRYAIEPQYPWYDGLKRFFDKMPPYLYTMGAASLMKVRHLVMIANGKAKAEAVKRFYDESVNTDFPASVLKLHPNFTVIIDKDAASLL